MSDRGEYRAIRRVLLDGPDFQRLPERARWVFVALKLNFGPAGIEVWYPAELVARLSVQTGASAGGVQDALNTLEREGWIQREGNVVWIVGHLANDPHVKRGDLKHRKMLQRHMEGLPRLAIVARFIKAHTEWFTEDGTASGAPSNALTWAIEQPEKALPRAIEGPLEGHRSTKNQTEDRTEDLTPSGDGEGGRDGEYPPAFDATWAVYPKRTGGNSKKESYAAWRARLRAGVPAEVLHAGVERYAAFCDAEGKTGTQYVMQGKTFFGPADHYLDAWESGKPKGKRDEIRVVNGWFAEVS